MGNALYSYAILAFSNPRAHFLQLSQYFLLLLTHSLIWQTAIEHLMVLGMEDLEMIKTQAPGTSICLKYAFYIDKIAIKLKKDSFFC